MNNLKIDLFFIYQFNISMNHLLSCILIELPCIILLVNPILGSICCILLMMISTYHIFHNYTHICLVIIRILGTILILLLLMLSIIICDLLCCIIAGLPYIILCSNPILYAEYSHLCLIYYILLILIIIYYTLTTRLRFYNYTYTCLMIIRILVLIYCVINSRSELIY